MTADFDGVLPDAGDMEDLEAFMRRVDEGDAAQAEADVYRSRGYILCPACKDAFLADPLGPRPSGERPTTGGRMH